VENFEHIFYLDCPHFTVGRADQWGEHGYLLHEGNVYWYEVDRKDQRVSTRSPMSVDDFLAYATARSIGIPDDFMSLLILTTDTMK
jgi:hypothetical protein